VLDEPTTALDTVTQKMIFDLIDDLRAESGFATLLVTHDLALACERADRIVRLANGRVIDDRPAAIVARELAVGARRAASVAEAVTESDLGSRAPGATGRESVIETRDLAVAYAVRGPLLSRKLGPPVVHDVSLAIAPGEALALVGNSGSGKTSFVRGLLRLVEPVSGAILYRARAGAALVDLRTLAGQNLRTVRPDLGVVFQDPSTSLDPRQRARDVLLEALAARGRTDSSEATIARLLDDVGLTSAHLSRFPHQLSGGEAQRLCLLRALATEPRVLVLDEALSSLDPQLRTRILDLLTRLRRDSGLACLLVTHDLGSVETFADRVAVMANGRIVETGPTATIFRTPQSAETRALLAARAGSVDLHAEIAPQDRA
jgi:peptide/nickel transport system ATP-binding protein